MKSKCESSVRKDHDMVGYLPLTFRINIRDDKISDEDFGQRNI
jgi:hypothetical protein